MYCKLPEHSIAVHIVLYIDSGLYIQPRYHISYSDQLVVVCGMPCHFPDWFVPDG